MWRKFIFSVITVVLVLLSVEFNGSGLLAFPQTRTTINQTSQNGEYYVIGLFSMRQKNNNSDDVVNFDDKAMRLYVKLRYFIGRQTTLVPYVNGTAIGFTAYDIGWDDRDRMVSAVVNILLEQKYRSNRIIDGGAKCEETRLEENGEQQSTSSDATQSSKNSKDNTTSSLPNHNRRCKNPSTNNNKKSNIFAVVSYMSDDMTKLAAAILSVERIPFFAYTQTEIIAPFEDNIYHWFFSSFGLLHHDINKMRTRIETSVAKDRLVVLLNLYSGTNLISNIHADELWDVLEQRGHCMASFSRPSDSGHPSHNITMETVVKHVKENGLSLDTSVVWVERKSRDALIRELESQRVYEKRWYIYSDRGFVADHTFNVSATMVRQMFLAFVPVLMYQKLNRRFPYKKMQTQVTRAIYKDILEDAWISEYLRVLNLTHVKHPFAWLDFHETVEDESIESILLPVWWSQPFQQFKNTDLDGVRELLAKLSSSTLRKAETKRRKEKTANFFEKTTIRCRKPRCTPGHEPRFEKYADAFWSMVKAWKCKQCLVNYYKLAYGNHTCLPCGRYLFSNSARTGCYDPYQDYYLTMQNYPGRAVVCLSAISLFVNIFIVVVFCMFRNTPVVRSTSLFTSLTQLALYLILFTSIPLTFVGEPRISLCVAQPVFIGFLMTLVVALSINRSRQLLSALRADRMRSPGQFQHFVSETMELFVLFLLLLVQVIVVAVSLIIVPPRVNMTKRSGAGKYLVDFACNTELHLDVQLCYVMLLAIHCVIQGYRARNLPKHFNDTVTTAYSMFVTVALISIKFPVTESFERGVLRTLVNAVAVILINLAQMMIMFAPKAYTVLFLRHRKQFHVYMFRRASAEVCSVKEQPTFKISGLQI